jgi:hypothetical protein
MQPIKIKVGRDMPPKLAQVVGIEALTGDNAVLGLESTRLVFQLCLRGVGQVAIVPENNGFWVIKGALTGTILVGLKRYSVRQEQDWQ